jgi:Fe2+ transport system protein FeoA
MTATRRSSTAARLTAPADGTAGERELRLDAVPLRQAVELVRIDLPPEELEPLLERGVLPGCELCAVRRSPSGDPIVAVDGTLLALRRETAGCLCVRIPGEAGDDARVLETVADAPMPEPISSAS